MSDAVLSLEGVVKRFGGLVATDHVDLHVGAHEVHALIGPNGAGKSTLINQIAGVLQPDAGKILFRGVNVAGEAPHTRVQHGLGRSYQITNIFRRLSVLDNARLAAQAAEHLCGQSSFNLWARRDAQAHLHEHAHALLERVGLRHRAATIAGTLAHGEQRQLEVALALATEPRLLLLDEPMAGMGPDESERMVTLIDSLRTDMSLLLVEHDMDAVFRLADTVSVLVYGRIIASGTPAAVREDPRVREAYLGTFDAAEGTA